MRHKKAIHSLIIKLIIIKVKVPNLKLNIGILTIIQSTKFPIFIALKIINILLNPYDCPVIQKQLTVIDKIGTNGKGAKK